MKKQLARMRVTGLVALILVVGVLATIVFLHHHTQPTPTPPAAIHAKTTISNPLKPWEKTNISWHRVVVKHGDSLAKIFAKFHLNYSQLQHLLKRPSMRHYFGTVHLGQTFYLHIGPKKQTVLIKYPLNDHETFFIYSDTQGTQEATVKKPMTTALVYKSSVIEQSFSTAARHAGLSYHLAADIARIFAGSVNFDALHRGDHFSVLYKEYYLNGKKDHAGPIMAASFTHHGKTHKAIRFTYPRHHVGYYTPEGKGVEPLFLKAPLKYKRISGRFTFTRYDPYLHIVHPHLGVDYAATRGTPIKTIGDGKVIFHGRKGGYGKSVIVRYSRKYRALYGHMSRIPSYIKNGHFVHKGQVIGYVGSTGWSTGPHLHFEMYVYGIPRNPLKMKFIGGKSIPKSYLAQFKQQAATLLAELERHQTTQLAYNG